MNARREIGCFLDPSLFSNPAYDILMGLLASEEENTSIGLTECALAADVAATSAIRWIRLLETRGLLIRVEANDQQHATLKLTVECRAALLTYLEQVSRVLSI